MSEESMEQVEETQVEETVEEEGSTDEVSVESEKPAYQSNFRYRVMNEEREIPERYRSLITDELTEKEVRELFEKSGGLDIVTKHRDELKGENGELKKKVTDFESKFDNFSRSINEIEHYRNSDLGLFLKQFQVSDDEILKYAERIIDAKEDPRIARQLMDSQSGIQQQYRLQNQSGNLQNENYQLRRELHQRELEMALGDPEIDAFKRRYDSVIGKPGAFDERVSEYGNHYFQTFQKNIRPRDAVKYVYDIEIKKLGPHSTADVSLNTTQEKKPTLPSIGAGSPNSPVKKRPKNLDELRKLAEQRIEELQDE